MTARNDMRDFVNGMDMVFKAWKVNNFYPFACAEEGEITMSSELLPASTATSGAWEEVRPSGRNGWSVSASGVLVLKDSIDVLWFSWELFLEQVRRIGLDLKIEWTDRNGFMKSATGKVYIPETTMNFKADDFARWLSKFQGSGPLDLSGVIATPVNTIRMRIDWIATGAEPNLVQDNRLIGKLANQVMEVSLEGDDKFQIISTGDPTHKQARLDNVAGTLRFLNDFTAGDYVRCEVE